MMASKTMTKPESSQLQHNSLSSSFFAGLSFPKVPTSITHSDSNYNIETESLMINHHIEAFLEKDETKIVEEMLQQIVEDKLKPSILSQKDYASLYITNDIITNTTSTYPELPLPIVSIVSMHYESNIEIGTQEGEEKVSLLEPEQHSFVMDRQPPQQQPGLNERINENNDSLLTDLISENARLYQEIESLKTSLSLAAPYINSNINTNMNAIMNTNIPVGLSLNSVRYNTGADYMIRNSNRNEGLVIQRGSGREEMGLEVGVGVGAREEEQLRLLMGSEPTRLQPGDGVEVKYVCCGR